jgi:uncharacterized protein (TIGR01777 family)
VRVAVTGATGLIGSAVVSALHARGDEATVLARDTARARKALGDVEVHRWEAGDGPVPADALAGRDGVVHLAGAPVSQRWTAAAKREIRESRVTGTREVVEGIRAAEPRPSVLVSGSAVGYYGARGDERIEESTGPGDDFLAQVCLAWEAEALEARDLDVRVVAPRTGVVLSHEGGALAKMLPFFRAGIGGPVAGGGQYMPWVHLEDVVGMILAALDGDRWEGPVNVSAPEPVTNKEFSRALGRALRRPAVLPVPALGIRALYGEMAHIVVTGQRAVPARAQALGYDFRHPDLDEALRSALG